MKRAYKVKVNILGTVYTVKILKNNKFLKEKNYGGFCQYSKHEISIRHIDDLQSSFEMKPTEEEKREYLNRIIRHEIIHAVFHECGLDDYSYDETLVDCLAIQFPKIVEILNKTEVK